MIAMVNKIVVGFCLMLASFSWASTSNCLSDPDFFQFLNGKIGTGNPTKPEFYLMECDTMIINKGITVQLAPNTYLAFADPQPHNVLIVKGTLIIEGDNNKKSYISNSLDTVLFSPSHLKENWGGILVEKEGQLTLNNAMVYGAPVPIHGFSRDIQISNSYFYNANNIINFLGEPLDLNSNKYLAEFNLAAYLDNQALKETPAPKSIPESTQEKTAKKKQQEKSFWKSPWPYIGLIGATSAAAVYLVLDLSEDPSEKSGDNSSLSADEFYDQPNDLNDQLESIDP